VIHSIAEWIVNTTADSPSLVPHGLGVFVVSAMINNGIKTAWTYEETPRWARFVLGFTMPLALNFFHLGERGPK
jgi:hypothetical protein